MKTDRLNKILHQFAHQHIHKYKVNRVLPELYDGLVAV